MPIYRGPSVIQRSERSVVAEPGEVVVEEHEEVREDWDENYVPIYQEEEELEESEVPDEVGNKFPLALPEYTEEPHDAKESTQGRQKGKGRGKAQTTPEL